MSVVVCILRSDELMLVFPRLPYSPPCLVSRPPSQDKTDDVVAKPDENGWTNLPLPHADDDGFEDGDDDGGDEIFKREGVKHLHTGPASGQVRDVLACAELLAANR